MNGKSASVSVGCKLGLESLEVLGMPVLIFWRKH